ncbi:amidase [Pontixanthobacter sp.]|uniref:amidase n=1 Tax=Pontixanthobacter sp. TaxID=2792078 RepID=UPI003C7CE0B8
MTLNNRMLTAFFSSACILGVTGPAFAQEQSGTIARIEQKVSHADDAIERIRQLDDAGPMLNAVIAYNPEAQALSDIMGKTALRGMPILVKDNIETIEWPTTAGSLALKNNLTHRDAPLVANIRAAGGVILGKTNLSEWANIRDSKSTSGWSAIGGLTRNPHAIDRNSCGSSSGSGAAVAAGFAWAAIGTETNGSITCTASINGVVGFKPSVGLVSRRHIIPISSTQDTAGPMAKTVTDAALLLGAMAGEDPQDAVTLTVPNRRLDYVAGLNEASLHGVRIGVMRNQIGDNGDVEAVFEVALADLQRAGAVLVDIEFEPNGQVYDDSFTVLLFELREEMGKYLRSIPKMDGPAQTPRSLADLIAFNSANSDTEMRYFGQGFFQIAERTTDRAAYETARTNAVRIAGEETIDMLLAKHNVTYLVAPTRGPSWPNDLVNGDNFNGSIGFGSPSAIAGYPHLTVPMGAVERLPVGISFFGAKWSDYEVLQAGAAYEKFRSASLPEPSFERWSSATE